ncbi:hypothetical protein RJT34_13192 [Clitoria ternatea]|uniref:Uncharacterized protein n=1 Tax=Clitoria ternatea TaxID=43366 RepID=A0AAN9JQ55_CLITE
MGAAALPGQRRSRLAKAQGRRAAGAMVQSYRRRGWREEGQDSGRHWSATRDLGRREGFGRGLRRLGRAPRRREVRRRGG